MSDTRSKIFISYSRRDADFAEALKQGLEAAGYAVLIDREGIAHGENWQARLSGLIGESDTVVFVLSPDSAASDVCGWEIRESRALSKRVIPVLWRAVDFADVPDELGALNAAPFDGPNAVTGLQKLIAALESDLDWLREHTRIAERAAEWAGSDRSGAFLLRGAALKSAQAWRDGKPSAAPELTEAQRAYLQASEEEESRVLSDERRRVDELAAAKDLAETERDAAEQARANETKAARRVVRATLAGLAAALILSAAAGYAGWTAYQNGLAFERAAEEAQANAVRAEDAATAAREEAARADASAREAIAQRDATLRLESRLLARSAQEVYEQGDVAQAMALARAALPRDVNNPDRPFAPEALQVLYNAWFDRRELVTIRDPDNPVWGATVAADGAVLSWSRRGQTATLWSPEGEKQVTVRHAPPAEDDATWLTGGFLRDGRFLTWGSYLNPGAKLWSRSGELIRDLPDIAVLNHTPGGRIVSSMATAEGDFDANRIKLVDVDGTPGPVISVDQRFFGAEFVGEDRLLTFVQSPPPNSPEPSNPIALRDVETGAVLREFGVERGSLRFIEVAFDRLMIGVADHFDPETNAPARAAIVWDLDSGEQVARLDAPNNGGSLQATVLADGRYVTWAGGGPDPNFIRVWTSDGEMQFEIEGGHGWELNGAKLAPDGRIVTWSNDGTAKFWDSATGEELAVLDHDPNPDHLVDSWVVSVEFTADNLVVTRSVDGSVGLWDLDEGYLVAKLRGHENRDISGSALLPKGRLATWDYRDGTLRFWSRTRGPQGPALRGFAEPVGQIFGTAIAPDGRVLTYSDDGKVRLWNTDSLQAEVTLDTGLRAVTHAEIRPDGRIIASGPIGPRSDNDVFAGRLMSADGTLGSWLEGTEELGSFRALFAPDGRVAVRSEDVMRFWDAGDGALLRAIPMAREYSRFDFARDGRLLGTRSSGPPSVWNADGSAGPAFEEDGARGGRFLSDDRIAIWTSERLRIYDAAGAVDAEVPFEASFSQHAVADDGWSVIWPQHSAAAQLYDGEGERVATLALSGDAISSALFTEDGRVILFSRSNAAHRVFGRDGTPGPSLQGRPRRVAEGDAAAAPDGRIVAWSNTGAGEDAPMLWQSEGGRGVRLPDHPGYVSGVHFLPDGRVLTWARLDFGGNWEYLPRLWPGDPQTMLEEVDPILEQLQPLTLQERCAYFLETGDACEPDAGP